MANVYESLSLPGIGVILGGPEGAQAPSLFFTFLLLCNPSFLQIDITRFECTHYPLFLKRSECTGIDIWAYKY